MVCGCCLPTRCPRRQTKIVYNLKGCKTLDIGSCETLRKKSGIPQKSQLLAFARRLAHEFAPPVLQWLPHFGNTTAFPLPLCELRSWLAAQRRRLRQRQGLASFPQRVRSAQSSGPAGNGVTAWVIWTPQDLRLTADTQMAEPGALAAEVRKFLNRSFMRLRLPIISLVTTCLSFLLKI